MIVLRTLGCAAEKADVLMVAERGSKRESLWSSATGSDWCAVTDACCKPASLCRCVIASLRSQDRYTKTSTKVGYRAMYRTKEQLEQPGLHIP